MMMMIMMIVMMNMGGHLVRSLFIDGLTQQLNGQLQTQHNYKKKTRTKHITTKQITA
jgi:hypothetical protein